MKFRHITPAILAVLIAAAPAIAQNAGNIPQLQPKDMAQYPSVIQAEGTATGTGSPTQFRLRCGYTVSGTAVQADPTTDELSLLSANAYTRYQIVNDKVVITGLDPSHPSATGGRAVQVQVADASGTMKASKCTQGGNDVLQSCTPTQPFATAGQMSTAISSLQQQCAAFLAKAQIDPSVYSAEKTVAWKAQIAQGIAGAE